MNRRNPVPRRMVRGYGSRGGTRGSDYPTDQEEECFELLRRAYAEARYNPGYKITKEQLEYLAQRVQKLRDLTKKVCEARSESYLSA